MDEISANEAAKILGVSSAQIRWYYRRGQLPGRRIGAQLLVFERSDVEQFVKPKKTGRPKTSGAAKEDAPMTKKGHVPRKLLAPDAAAAPESKPAKGKLGPKGGKPS